MKMVHLTIHTKKLKESVAFYQDILGFFVEERFYGLGGKSIVFLGSKDNQVRIELIENKEPPCLGAAFSVGFHVDDIALAYKRMEALGLNPSHISSPNPSTQFFFLSDPNGLRIQLISQDKNDYK